MFNRPNLIKSVAENRTRLLINFRTPTKNITLVNFNHSRWHNTRIMLNIKPRSSRTSLRGISKMPVALIVQIESCVIASSTQQDQRLSRHTGEHYLEKHLHFSIVIKRTGNEYFLHWKLVPSSWVPQSLFFETFAIYILRYFANSTSNYEIFIRFKTNLIRLYTNIGT